MRPIYERPGDRINERAVADRLGQLAKLEAISLPARYPIDFALISKAKSVKMWLEIKCRKNARAAYPTYLLSLAKYHHMLELQERSGLPCRLAVQWSDCLGVLEIPAEHKITIGGRTDRNDAQDLEPVALLPVGLFRIIS